MVSARPAHTHTRTHTHTWIERGREERGREGGRERSREGGGGGEERGREGRRESLERTLQCHALTASFFCSSQGGI